MQEPLRPIAAQLKFIDDRGAPLGLTRLCGRAAPGERVPEATPGYAGKPSTLVAALGLSAISATWLMEGALTQAAVEPDVTAVLAPTLPAGDVVLLDNLNVHTSEAVQRQIRARGARWDFLPPSSPDLNPIEQCWAKVKAVWRKLKARTVDELVEALGVAVESITPQAMRAGFAHCG